MQGHVGFNQAPRIQGFVCGKGFGIIGALGLCSESYDFVYDETSDFLWPRL